LVLLDVYYRGLRGEPWAVEDYLDRFPLLDRDWLSEQLVVPPGGKTGPAADGFDSGADTVSAPSSPRVRCPHCQNPIAVGTFSSDGVLCPGCGNSFSIRDARPTCSSAPMKPLGKFQLLERVGVGAFGAVWRARDTTLDRIVALKIPHTGLLTAADELERF